MFPNPQDALLLPPRPDLEQYRKLAKELVHVCRARGPDAPDAPDDTDAPAAIGAWAEHWLAALAKASGAAHSERELDRCVRDLEQFVLRRKEAAGGALQLADAQFVLARSHGFDSWPKFAAHLSELARAGTETAEFEAAADALVAGDEAGLRRILSANPALVRARSTREHRATLLHYASANGVEGYRQVTPRNIVALAKLLLASGAEVDAEAEVYRGKCTPLGLVATSAHPRQAGVQEELMQLLLDHGADVNRPGMVGNAHGTVFACFANGCPEAAAYLADRGARVGLIEAAGLGRLDVVRTFFDAAGRPKPEISGELVNHALWFACGGGSAEVAAFLLDHGASLEASDVDRQTALHHAVMAGEPGLVELLIARGALLEARNVYGGTALGQGVWSAGHGGDPESFAAIVETLIAAGASVPQAHPPVNARVDSVLARHGCVADPSRYWFGEEPRKR